MQGLFSTSFHSNQSQGGPQGISKRQQVSSKTTLDLERRAQDLKDTAKRARAQGWSQIAIQAVDQEAKQARAAWENSYRADEDVDINRKRDQAQHFKNNAKTARQSGLGPLAIAAAEKEADDAYRVYEQAYQETARRRRHFANSISNQPNPTSSLFASTNAANLQQQQPGGVTRIDLEHLRPTTKYDQLTEALQKELDEADKAILTQIHHCEELEITLLPKVQESGAQIPAEIEHIAHKLDSVQDGFGLDAEEEQYLEKWLLKKDAGELRLVGRNIERVKAPRQYQLGPGSQVGADGVPGSSGPGVFNAGLSGWWNNPQTVRATLRSGTRVRGVQIPQEDDADVEEYVDPRVKPPANLVDLFDRRADEMRKTLADNKRVLGEIEEYVEGVDAKVRNRERDLMEQQEYGYAYNGANGADGHSERVRQRKLLNLAFEEAHRGLFDVAVRVAELREGLTRVTGPT